MSTVEPAPWSLRSWSLRPLLFLWLAFCKATRHNLFLCYRCLSFLSNTLMYYLSLSVESEAKVSPCHCLFFSYHSVSGCFGCVETVVWNVFILTTKLCNEWNILSLLICILMGLVFSVTYNNCVLPSTFLPSTPWNAFP